MTKRNIIGIYLAAGSSRRFGYDKLSFPFKGKPIGAHALSTALNSKLHSVSVVTKGGHIRWLTPFLTNEKCRQIICDKAYLGQSESIKCGLHAAEAYNAEAMMILLADQPCIKVNLINQLIDTFISEKNALFVAFRYEHIICPPILMSRKMFQGLYQLKGDQGAKSLLLDKASEGMFIELSEQSLFFDIDTKEDYKYMLQRN